MFYIRHAFLYFESFISPICDHRVYVTCQKASSVKIRLRFILSNTSWLIEANLVDLARLFSVLALIVESSWASLLGVHFCSKADGCCDHTVMHFDLGVHPEYLCIFPQVSVLRPHSSSDQPEAVFALEALSWEVGWSPMEHMRLNNICSCRRRNMRQLGDGLTAFTSLSISMFFLSSRQLSPLCTLVHVQCGAHNDIKLPDGDFLFLQMG